MLTHVYPRYEGDIMGCHIHRLAKAFYEKGHKVIVVAPIGRNLKTKEFIDGVTIIRFKYFFKNYQDLCYEYRFKEKVFSLIGLVKFICLIVCGVKEVIRQNSKHDIEIIHAQWSFPAGLIAYLSSFLKNLKWFVTFHGEDIRLLDYKFFRYVTKLIINKCNGITLVSKEAYIPFFHNLKNKIDFIPMPIENNFFETEPLNKTSDHKVFLCVSSLTPQKRVHNLIEAFHKLKLEKDNIKLNIVGSGPERSNLEILVKQWNLEDSVIFLGNIESSKMVHVYDKADIFILVSKGEGLGISAAEAMIRGKPAILAYDSGLKTFSEAGAIFIKLGDTSDIATKMKETLTKLPDFNPDISKNFVKNTFHGHSVVERFLFFYGNKLQDANSK